MKKGAHHITDELLAKCLLGEATVAEREQVRQWLSESPGNRRHFEHFKLIWEQSRQLEAEQTVDETRAWEQLQHRMQAAAQGAAPPLPKRPVWIWAAAAVLAAVLAGSLLYFRAERQLIPAPLSSAGGILTDTLPDGSVVTLNKQSTLTRPGRFAGKERRVQLQGEAFFVIRPDRERPFIVEANGSTIRVLGTAFNVKTVAGKTEVIVESGAVAVTRHRYTVQLHAREKALVSGAEAPPVIEENRDELYRYYRTRQFVCNATPLWKLAEKLNEAYNVHIVIVNDRLKDLPLTTTFDNASLEHILSIISKTFPGMQVERNGGQIRLK